MRVKPSERRPASLTHRAPVGAAPQTRPSRSPDAYRGTQPALALAAAPASGEAFPFSRGAAGTLSPPVDFSRFLSLPDPTDADILYQTRTVLADYLATGQFGELEGEGGLKLRYAVYGPPPGTPVKKVINFALGNDESFVKYGELLFNFRALRAEGYAFALMDHRGVGFSERELHDEPQKHTLGDFEDMVSDQHAFTEVLRRELGAEVPYAFVGTSLGGGVATRYMQEHPGRYQQAALLAPMLDINTKLPDRVESAVANLTGWLAPNQYVPGQGAYRPKPFEGNSLTDCAERFEVPNLLAERYPQIRVGGVTWGFAKTAVHATRQMMRAEELEKLRGVDLHFFAASHDTRVETKTVAEAAARLGAPLEVLSQQRADGSKAPVLHDLMSHRDPVRSQLVAALRELLTR